jgi:hypothetical protein
MKLHKKIWLDGNFVNAELYRDGVMFKRTVFITNPIADYFAPSSAKKAYARANKWADAMLKVEAEADHGGE